MTVSEILVQAFHRMVLAVGEDDDINQNFRTQILQSYRSNLFVSETLV